MIVKLETVAELAGASYGEGRRYPVNAPSQLVASLLAAPHLLLHGRDLLLEERFVLPALVK